MTSRERKAARSPEAGELASSVHDMIRVLLHHLQPIVEAEGISKGGFWAMHVLSGIGEGSVNDVAQHLAVSPPTCSVTIDQLETAGLVTRVRSPDDRRAVKVSLTPKGRKIEARVWTTIESQIAAAITDLPRSEVATTSHVIRELSRRLEVSPSAEVDQR